MASTDSLIINIREFINDEISKMKNRIYITKVTKGKRGKEDIIEVLDNKEIFEEELVFTKARISVWESYSSVHDNELFDKIVKDLKDNTQNLKLDYQTAEQNLTTFTTDLAKKEEYFVQIKTKFNNIKNNVYDDEGKGYDLSENKPMKLPELKVQIDQHNRDLPLLRRKGKQIKEHVVRVRKFLENAIRCQKLIQTIVKDSESQTITTDSSSEVTVSPLDTLKPAFEGCWLCGDDVECTCA